MLSCLRSDVFNFSVGDRSELQTGRVCTTSFWLGSHAVVTHRECSFIVLLDLEETSLKTSGTFQMQWQLCRCYSCHFLFLNFSLVAIWMVFFLLSLEDLTFLRCINNVKCGTMRPQHTFPLCVSILQPDDLQLQFLNVFDVFALCSKILPFASWIVNKWAFLENPVISLKKTTQNNQSDWCGKIYFLYTVVRFWWMITLSLSILT